MALGLDECLEGLVVAALLVPGAGDIEAVAGGALAGGQGAGQDQAGRAEGADGVTEGVVNFPRNSAVNSHNFVV